MPRLLFGGALIFVFGLCVAAGGQGGRPGLTVVDPCRLDPLSPQCLRSRIELLSSQLDQANNSIDALRANMTAIQKSIGQKGKADGGFDDVWAAIDDINARLKNMKN